ncbi:MAG: autotransporter domain-containing protein, partial [Chlamydiota bacterium]
LQVTSTVDTSFTSSGSGINGSGGSLIKNGAATTLRLIGANTYTGGTTINAGTIASFDDTSLGAVTGQLNFNGGTLELDGPTSTTRVFNFMAGGGTVNVGSVVTLGSGITGAGNFLKTGVGSMYLAAASNPGYSGSVTIDQGLLAVEGTLIVPVTVNSSGTLGGIGTVGNLISSGTVSPGNSIGTLHVAGNYTQNPSGHLFIEIDSLGNSDLLDITGTAALDGSLDVLPLQGAYFAGSNIVYRVLHADGGSSGQFTAVNVLDPGGILKLNIQYTANDVFLGVLNNRFFIQPTITEHNPREVGLYLESLQYFEGGQPIPAQEDLISVIEAIARLNPNQRVKALDQLHPAQFGEFGLLNSDLRSQIASILTIRPTAQCCNHMVEFVNTENSSLWFEPFGMHIHQKPRSDQRGFISDTGGAMIGGDYCFGSGIVLGAAIGGNTTYLKWSEGMGHAHIPSAFMSIYADWSNAWAFVETSVLGAFDYFHTVRHIHFTGENRKATSRHNGYDWSAHLGGGGDFHIGVVDFEPFFNLDYSSLHQNGFREHGANSLNLKVQDKDFGMLRAEEGISVAKSFKTRRGCWSPRIWMSLVTSVPLYGKNYRSSLQGQDSSFTVWTYHKTVNRFSPGLELIWS